MLNLQIKPPNHYKQFADSFFTIAKTHNPFSLIGFDQNHEQLIKELKIHSGTLNLSDECVFTEWSVAGPEVAQFIAEFEAGKCPKQIYSRHEGTCFNISRGGKSL